MRKRLIADLKEHYGVACREYEPVAGGYLNLKWRVSADGGELLVKEFDRGRFGDAALADIERALFRQIHARACGVPCPEVWTRGGRVIRHMDDGTAYMVMGFCPGRMEGPETITPAQMESLGDACGRMHAAFALLPAEGVKGYPLGGAAVLSALWENYETRARESCESPAGYRDALRALEPVLRGLTASFLDAQPRGIAHEDFSGDNMLFDAEGVTAIVDFDRGQYGFQRHDVARALLSLAWRDGALDAERVRAFVAGYARHRPLSTADVPDALRVAWCVESPWWIRPEFFGAPHAKVRRFRDEMLWLTRNWSELDSLANP